jgi:hypothetical protein
MTHDGVSLFLAITTFLLLRRRDRLVPTIEALLLVYQVVHSIDPRIGVLNEEDAVLFHSDISLGGVSILHLRLKTILGYLFTLVELCQLLQENHLLLLILDKSAFFLLCS